jgi:hypothetical protein
MSAITGDEIRDDGTGAEWENKGCKRIKKEALVK